MYLNFLDKIVLSYFPLPCKKYNFPQFTNVTLFRHNSWTLFVLNLNEFDLSPCSQAHLFLELIIANLCGFLQHPLQFCDLFILCFYHLLGFLANILNCRVKSLKVKKPYISFYCSPCIKSQNYTVNKLSYTSLFIHYSIVAFYC